MLIATAIALAFMASAQSAITSVEVWQTEDGYVVDLVMWVPAPRETVFAVLVDFEHMARWVPNVQESRVLERQTNRATVEYHGVVRYGLLSVPFTTVRDVEFAAPTSLRTVQIGGSMKRHKSRIDLVSAGAGTRLEYHVEMVPGVFTALLLSTRRVELELREHFGAIAAEILKRNEAAAAPSR